MKNDKPRISDSELTHHYQDSKLEHGNFSATYPKFWIEAYACIALIWTKSFTLSYSNCKMLSEMSYFPDQRVEFLKAVG